MRVLGKVAALAMTAALALALTACGGSGSSGAAESASSAAESASSAAASESASSSAAAAKFQIGTVNGNSYANKFFGTTFTLPEGWSFATSDELAQLNGTIGSIIDDETVTEALESGVAFVDMYAKAADGLSNVNVTIEYASDPSVAAMTSEQYLQSTVDILQNQLSVSGIDVKSAEVGTYSNGGNEFAALNLELDVNGTTMYEKMINVKEGDYFMSLTATSTDASALETILSNVVKKA